jgi:bifunctional DNA-binding transcriptional regulator/antitoxin component of YhaV-PrlF toxin-antitoxin module
MIYRRVVKQASGVYTITIPKSIVEAHGWENAEFILEIDGDRIILTKTRNKNK